MVPNKYVKIQGSHYAENDVLTEIQPMGQDKKRTITIMEYIIINPKTTDVDEHINLINTLGDMVDQKEEAKKEKFIETMPTMIQTI